MLKTWRALAGGLLAELYGGLIANGPMLTPVVTLTYGASVAVNAAAGNAFAVSATDAVAFAIAEPTNPPPTGFAQSITLTIRNASAGALGALTFNAAFKIGAAWTQPAAGTSRTIGFVWNGTNWVETFRSANNVSN